MFIFFQAIIAGAGAAIGVSAVYMPFAIINEFLNNKIHDAEITN